jgi:hypothetical protein
MPDFMTEIYFSFENGARQRAYKFGRHMTWPSVANQLQQIFREVLLFTYLVSLNETLTLTRFPQYRSLIKYRKEMS